MAVGVRICGLDRNCYEILGDIGYLWVESWWNLMGPCCSPPPFLPRITHAIKPQMTCYFSLDGITSANPSILCSRHLGHSKLLRPDAPRDPLL